MKVLKRLLGAVPTSSDGRVRNYLANPSLGATQSTIHENVINPGGAVPWHYHATEEILVVLEGDGQALTDIGAEFYAAGDVVIIPAGRKHSLRNTGTVPLRQLCFFPGDPGTVRLEGEAYDGQSFTVVNAT
ncbi:MAG: cupin domain-containing protein [Hyphomicrobiaceae bacterium]